MKRIFSVIAVLTVLTLGIQAKHVRAEESPMAKDVLGEEAAVLEKTLDVLGVVLGQISQNAKTNGSLAPLSSEVSSVLDGISKSLVTINASLENRAVAFAGNNPVVAEKPVTPPVLVGPLPSEKPVSKEPVISLKEPLIPSEAVIATNEENEEVASVSVGFNKRNIFWSSVAVVAIFSIILLMRRRGGEDVETAAATQRAKS